MKYLILIPIICSVHFAFSFSAKFLHLKGEVKLNGKIVKKHTTKIKRPYLVETGAKSLAVIKVDDSTLKINENSTIDLSKMGSQTPSTELKRGSLFSFIKKSVNKKQRNSFSLKAKGVAMGVRGTAFFASYGKEGDVWMCVNEGKVAVTNDGFKKEIIVNAGEGIVAKPGKSVSTPKSLPWTKKLNWDYDPEKGNLENTVKIQEAYTDILDFDYD